MRLTAFIITLLTSFLIGHAQSYNYFGRKDAIINDLCFSNDGKLLAIPEDSNIYVFDIDNQLVSKKLIGVHKNQILSLDLSYDNSLIVSGGKDSSIVVWDMLKNEPVSKLNYHRGVVTAIKISKDQKYIASGSSDKTVIIYNLLTKEIAFKFNAHTDDITSVAFSSDGKLFCCSSGDHTISLFKTSDWSLIKVLNGHKDWVRDIKFSADNTKIFSCGDDGRVLQWNIYDLNNITSNLLYRHKKGWLLSLDTDPESVYFLTGNLNGLLQVETVNSKDVYSFDCGKVIQKAKFRPHSKELEIAAATRGKAAIIINFNEMKRLK